MYPEHYHRYRILLILNYLFMVESCLFYHHERYNNKYVEYYMSGDFIFNYTITFTIILKAITTTTDEKIMNAHESYNNITFVYTKYEKIYIKATFIKSFLYCLIGIILIIYSHNNVYFWIIYYFNVLSLILSTYPYNSIDDTYAIMARVENYGSV